jgi:precorrin-8X/cobalt-precorrin-8 methylmutase
MDETALVLIGHGSKLPYNKENLEKLADMLRRKSRFKTVEISFMVRNKPSIPEAIEGIVKRGIKKIVLVPAFLAAGVHTEQEIPEMIGLKGEEPEFKTRGIQILYGDPIGPDERIADIIEEKALKALGQRENVKAANYAETIPAAKETFTTSMTIIRKELGNALDNLPPGHAAIIERVVHTTADPEFAKLLIIHEKAIDAGVAAIKAGAKIITDVKMVKAGINESRVRRFGGKTLTYIDDPRAIKLAENESLTRSAAAMRLAVEEGVDGAIILIGNAPTAAFELADLVKKGKAKPALVVATPVGYIGAAESKEVVETLPVPYMTNRGRKGGSAVTVAVFNALLGIAEGKKQT